MRTNDVLKIYETRRAIAELLGLSRQAVYAWGDKVPELQAMRLAWLSAGRLQFDPGSYVRKHRAAPLDRVSESGVYIMRRSNELDKEHCQDSGGEDSGLPRRAPT